MIAGTIETRAENQYLTTTDEHVISTSSQTPIKLQANRLNSSVTALTIDTDNACVFGASVDVNGAVACAELSATSGIRTSFVKALAGSSLVLGNDLGSGLLITNNGAVGIFKEPREALDVLGTIACTNLNAASAITVGGINIINSLDANEVNLTALQNEVAGKSPLLTNLEGTGTDFLFDSATGVLRKIYGNDGIVVDQTVNLEDPSDPSNYQIRISGTSILTSLETKQDALSTAAGQGVSILSSPTELRRIFGEDGITCAAFLDLNDPTDPRNFNLQVSGAALQTQITDGLALKQATLDSTSNVLV